MHIHKIVIRNYKCFLTPQEMRFESGFNIVVGANNAGKTAMVEALSTQFEDKPHRNSNTVPAGAGHPPGNSQIHITFELSRQEFLDSLWNYSSKFAIRYNPKETVDAQAARILKSLSSTPIFHVECIFAPGKLQSASIQELETHTRADMAIQFILQNRDLPASLATQNLAVTEDSLVAYQLAALFSKRIYHFRAERFNVGQFAVGANPILKSDASDLAQVLHYLQTSNPARFTKLIELVNIVFPDIKHVTVPPMSNSPNTVRILLWYVDAESEREDLAVPLQESGTGIGQMLAILYVAINSPFPRPIIVDEPQSFLHPTAIRKLFDILRHQFPQHQYIATTHSPLVIAAAAPRNIVCLQKEGTETRAQRIDSSQADDLRTVLAAVGARLSDVFGAENIVWVEGSTEESCFPVIVSEILKKQLLATAIIGVLNPGDFEGRHSEVTLRIYRRLSRSTALLPPAIGFIFDREGRSDSEMQDLVRESDGKVRFLSRRMYENYLLNAEAIVHVVSQLEEFSGQRINPEDVSSWLEDNRWAPRYFDSVNALPARDHDAWLRQVHGAKLLNDLFSTLSGGRYTYDKIRYGLALTNWLVQNRPEELNEVAQLLDETLSSNGTQLSVP